MVKYIAKIKVSKHNSFLTRKKLSKMGFVIYVYDDLTNKPTILKEKYSLPERVYFSNKNVNLVCIYNGETLPKGLLELIATDANITEYTIEKRVV